MVEQQRRDVSLTNHDQRSYGICLHEAKSRLAAPISLRRRPLGERGWSQPCTNAILIEKRDTSEHHQRWNVV